MNQWVYNRSTDIKVFGGAIILAFILGHLFPVHSGLSLVFLFYYLDTPHRLVTYFYTLTSQRINSSQQKYFFWLMPFLIYSLNVLMVSNGMFDILFKIYALASVYHFMKQSQAWITISTKKVETLYRYENIINSSASYCVVWLPQIMSMANEKPIGWFKSGDIIAIPTYFKELSIVVFVFVGLIYMSQEVKRWMDTKTIHWGKNFHLLIALSVWSIARLGILNSFSPSLSIFIMISCHTLPYLFLSQRYLKDRRIKGETFWPYISHYGLFLFWIILGCLILTSFEFYYLYFSKEKTEYLTSIILALATTHYIYDSYLWKKATHPEGAQALCS